MIDETLLTEMKDFALKLAPELNAQPLYVINKPPAYDIDGINAVCVGGFCPVLQQFLEDTGRWQGPGPFVVFVNRALPRAAALVVLVHELAHCLPARPIVDAPMTPEALIECQRTIDAWKANPENAHPDVPPWLPDHDKNFHRTVLHLWWRSVELGEFLPLDPLGFDAYGLTPCYSYWRALGAEPALMRDKTFDEILATELPPAFRALWSYDLRAWLDLNPKVAERIKVA